MKVAVVGAGAMGSLFGARLALAGHEVALVDVNRAHVEAVNAHGLLLSADDGVHEVRVRAGAAEDFADPVEMLLLFTKGQHSQAALASARHLVGSQSWVLTLQNGLGTGERITALWPEVPVAIGMTDWPADLTGPGQLSTHGQGKVRLWSLSGEDHPMLHAMAGALDGAGMACRPDPGVEVAIWEKVIFNAVMNPVAALTRQTVGGMAAHPDGPVLAETIMAEAFAVARACGMAVDEARVRGNVAFAYREHGPHRPSMLSDVLAGRQTEIDAINGALVERAARHGVGVPTLEAMARLVRMIRAG